MNRVLSIVISVYNGEKFLQTFFKHLEWDNENIEFVFINDGSTDNSLEIIEEFIKDKDNMFAYSKENGGLSSARNFGVKNSKGKYILFADCDDYFSKNAMEVILDSLKNKADLYVFDFNKVIDNETMASWIKLPEDGYCEFDKNMVVEDYLNGKLNDIIGPFAWNKVYKKSIIVKNELLFYEEKILNEDVLFNIHYLMHSNKTYVTNQRIYNYVIHKNSITRRYKTWLIKAMENNYSLVPKISEKYNYKNYDKYIMKIIIPYFLTIIRNESNGEFWDGLVKLKKFFSSKNFKKYLKTLDKSCLTKKELLYYYFIVIKMYFPLYVICFLKNHLTKGE